MPSRSLLLAIPLALAQTLVVGGIAAYGGEHPSVPRAIGQTPTLLLAQLTQPNPTQPNPTQPNPAQPNPVRQGICNKGQGAYSCLLTETPKACPKGTEAVLYRQAVCAPCVAGSTQCPCAPALYECRQRTCPGR